MKRLLIITFLIITIKSNSQINSGYYIGMERMCWINESGRKECYDAPRKWYHLNHLLVLNDSVYIYKVPIRISHKDTMFSASDGAFYYYVGKIHTMENDVFVSLVMTDCDYCAKKVSFDTATNTYTPIIDTLKFPVMILNTQIEFDNVKYIFQLSKVFPIQDKYLKQAFRNNNLPYKIE